MAESNKYFSLLASGIFKRKFSKKVIKIMGSSAIGSVKHIYYNDDTIELQDYETIPKVLRHFGHLISRLKLEHSFVFDSKIKHINRYINLYCDSMVDFDVHSANEDFFHEMTKSFERVENLVIRGRFKSLDSKTLNLNELYPAMKRLSLRNVKVFDFSWTHLQHTNLEYLSVDVSQNVDAKMAAKYLSEADAHIIIKNNPEIRSITLGSITQNLLKLVARDLQRLEQLALEEYDEWNPNFEHRNIFFSNVKRFTMKSGSHSVPENLKFASLEEFEADGFPKYCTRWIDFIINTTSLRKVRVDARHIKNSELLRLARANLKLSEISLMCANDVSDDTIINLIKNSKNLRRVHLKKFLLPNTDFADTRSLNSHTVKILVQGLNREWLVHETDYEIILER